MVDVEVVGVSEWIWDVAREGVLFILGARGWIHEKFSCCKMTKSFIESNDEWAAPISDHHKVN